MNNDVAGFTIAHLQWLHTECACRNMSTWSWSYWKRKNCLLYGSWRIWRHSGDGCAILRPDSWLRLAHVRVQTNSAAFAVVQTRHSHSCLASRALTLACSAHERDIYQASAKRVPMLQRHAFLPSRRKTDRHGRPGDSPQSLRYRHDILYQMIINIPSCAGAATNVSAKEFVSGNGRESWTGVTWFSLPNGNKATNATYETSEPYE